jgi:hypothetical protein
MENKLVISMDGGGALGRGVIEFLASLEEQYGTTPEVMVTGTSVGGMLALLRAAGHSWREIRKIAEEAMPMIFGERDLFPMRPKWKDNGREAICKKFLDIPCSGAKVPFYVVSFDSRTGEGVLFSKESDWTMADVAMATSAANTYFPAFRGHYVDGGLVANNPALVALAGAIRQGLANLQNVHLLSFATGGKFWEPTTFGNFTSLVTQGKFVLKAALAGGQETNAEIVRTMIGDRQLRIQPDDKKDYPMDDLSVIDEYVGLWRQAYDQHHEEVARFAGLLA